MHDQNQYLLILLEQKEEEEKETPSCQIAWSFV
jgi:hypothetical protein